MSDKLEYLRLENPVATSVIMDSLRHELDLYEKRIATCFTKLGKVRRENGVILGEGCYMVVFGVYGKGYYASISRKVNNNLYYITDNYNSEGAKVSTEEGATR